MIRGGCPLQSTSAGYRVLVAGVRVWVRVEGLEMRIPLQTKGKMLEARVGIEPMMQRKTVITTLIVSGCFLSADSTDDS